MEWPSLSKRCILEETKMALSPGEGQVVGDLLCPYAEMTPHEPRDKLSGASVLLLRCPLRRLW